MRLYLDDCANSDLLADLLRRAGHHVVRPADAGIAWQNDGVHFSYAATNGLTLITKNPADFLALHQIDSNHAGIFAIYQDNDKTRDMRDPDIVAAIGRLEAAVAHGYVIASEFHRLNDWR